MQNNSGYILAYFSRTENDTNNITYTRIVYVNGISAPIQTNVYSLIPVLQLADCTPTY